MMLLNCAVDLLRQGKSVLYIDSELNSRMFTCRLLAHLTRIECSEIWCHQMSLKFQALQPLSAPTR